MSCRSDARRLLIRALVTACLTASVAAVGAQAPTPAAPAEAISPSALMETVRTLASPAFEGRRVGTPGGQRARTWILERLRTIGLSALGEGFEHPFEFTPRGANGQDRAAPERGVNLLALCPGRDPSLPLIVLSAHYDHLGVREGQLHPGADDNASGVAVLLEIAAVCVERPFHHGVIIAAFDGEEAGLQGARAFVAAPPVAKERLALNVNLDMLARGDKGELYAAGLHHAPTLRPLLEPVVRRAPIALRFGHDRPGSGTDDWTTQSDHAAFHDAGIPFVYFGVEDHADYHKPTDTVDRIDPQFFARAAGVVLDALGALDDGLRQARPV